MSPGPARSRPRRPARASGGASPRRTLGIAAGGTAGHVTIAIAIAESLRSADPGAEVLFFGAAHGVERTLVPAAGFPLELLPGAPFQRRGLAGKLLALARAARSIPPARRRLVEHGVRAVIGTGGYASFGALVAARSLGIPTAIHEANAVPGLANRVLGRVVERVYLSHPSAWRRFPPDRCRVVGTPLRAVIAARAALERRPPQPGRPAHILVTAGSEGSRFLDREVPRLLADIARRGVAVEARHQVGAAEPDRVRAAYAGCGVEAQVATFPDDMGAAYDWADFAIACCGAGTVAELSALGLPALLVPVGGTAEDHQYANARLHAANAGAWTVREEEWDTAALAARAAEILSNPAAWSEASLATTGPASDAAAALARDWLHWIGG